MRQLAATAFKAASATSLLSAAERDQPAVGPGRGRTVRVRRGRLAAALGRRVAVVRQTDRVVLVLVHGSVRSSVISCRQHAPRSDVADLTDVACQGFTEPIAAFIEGLIHVDERVGVPMLPRGISAGGRRPSRTAPGSPRARSPTVAVTGSRTGTDGLAPRRTSPARPGHLLPGKPPDRRCGLHGPGGCLACG